MICPRCRASMAGNVSFCTNCGAQFGTAGQRSHGSSGAAQPAGTGWQFGAYLGLLAALVACGAIVVPAIGTMQGGTSAR